MTTSDKLREIAEKYKTGGYRIVNDYAGNKTMQRYDNENELLSDLTALISENYVEKEAYIALENTLAKTEAALLDAREATGYPVEFVEWLIKDQEIFFGELNEEYILNDNIHVGGRKLQTIDELFNYWKENEQ
jgi:hypothetical protein